MFNNNNIFDSKFKRKMSIRRKEKDAKAISRDFFLLIKNSRHACDTMAQSSNKV